MKPKPESVEQTFARVFGAPEKRAPVPPRPVADVLRATLAPRLSKAPPACTMSDDDLAFAASTVRIYLDCAEVAMLTLLRIAASVERTGAEENLVRQIDLLHERMAREGVDEDSMRKVAALRYKVSDASEASRLAPEVREILLKIFNQAMDICDALASFVAKVTKYISKVQLLLLDTESLFDKADDILFLRAIKTELALLG